VQLKSIRLLLILAPIFNLTVYHFDVCQAFLNSPIEYDIYVELPKGFTAFGDFRYAKLRKSLYGLKQAAYDWNKLQNEFIMQYDNRWMKSMIEPCLYYLIDGPLICYMLVQVDDYIFGTNQQEYYMNFTKAYNDKYGIDDLGEISYVMQTKVIRTPSGYQLSSIGKIDKILEKFDMVKCKTQDTPMPPGTQYEKHPSPDRDVPYLPMLGSVAWVGRVDRPDISFPCSYHAQFCHTYGPEHFSGLQRILRYLKHTRDHVLDLSPTTSTVVQDGVTLPEIVITQYVDADWAGDKLDRKSVSGGLTYVNGALADWGSCKQKTVATSSYEAEYVSTSEGAKDAMHVCNLTEEVTKGIAHVRRPVMIFGDNQGAIQLARNAVNNRRSRHIDIRVHAVRDWSYKKWVKLEWVPTAENWSDMMTKALGAPTLKKMRDRACVRVSKYLQDFIKKKQSSS
jgi:hypothetical protein